LEALAIDHHDVLPYISRVAFSKEHFCRNVGHEKNARERSEASLKGKRAHGQRPADARPLT
jgi:hypothetical protein